MQTTTTQHESKPTSHAAPNEGLYFTILIVLAMMTLIELLVTYLPSFVKIPLLLVLALTKAWLVVQFYMHLRYDNKIFTWTLMIPVVFGLLMTLIIQPLASAYYR